MWKYIGESGYHSHTLAHNWLCMLACLKAVKNPTIPTVKESVQVCSTFLRPFEPMLFFSILTMSKETLFIERLLYAMPCIWMFYVHYFFHNYPIKEMLVLPLFTRTWGLKKTRILLKVSQLVLKRVRFGPTWFCTRTMALCLGHGLLDCL